MEIKYLEWNLHSMGGHGYEIPTFICNYIKEVDIFVLVEFSNRKGWDLFRETMKEFDLYCSPYCSEGYNQVCIGIRKKMNYRLCSVITKDVCNIEIPEFLQVDIEINHKQVSIIGTRIKTESDTISRQFNFLKQVFKPIDNLICLGDFNAVHDSLKKIFAPDITVYGPRIVNGYFSFVHENGDKPECGLDWLISKGIVNIYNGYHDRKESPKATYDWSFVNNINGYGSKSKHDYLGINGLPDHAILKGMIEI